MADADFVEDDTGSQFRFTCKYKRDKSLIDLAGATISLTWRNEGDTADIVKAMTIFGTPANGVVDYVFLVGELYPPFMTFEVKIVDAATLILKNLTAIKVMVRKKLEA